MIQAFKNLLKQWLPRQWVAAVQLAKAVSPRLDRLEKQSTLLSEAMARSQHAALLPDASESTAFNRHELKVYSQNGEDGLLLHLFETVGTGRRTFIEFGIGDGRECNTANLSLNFGWSGLLMDCDPEKVAKARAYYARQLGARQDAVSVHECMVTKDNIDKTLTEHGPGADLDLLSIDVDGNDYWIWQAIVSLSPRVVVAEYNAAFGFERAITVPYDPGFRRWEKHPGGLYFGASLAALAKLGEEKGYRLVGCDRHGVNAFFVRQDLAVDDLPAVEVRDAYFPLDDRLLGVAGPERFAEIAAMPFDEV